MQMCDNSIKHYDGIHQGIESNVDSAPLDLPQEGIKKTEAKSIEHVLVADPKEIYDYFDTIKQQTLDNYKKADKDYKYHISHDVYADRHAFNETKNKYGDKIMELEFFQQLKESLDEWDHMEEEC